MRIYNGKIIKCPFRASLVIQNLYISCTENPLEFQFPVLTLQCHLLTIPYNLTNGYTVLLNLRGVSKNLIKEIILSNCYQILLNSE